MELEQIGEPAWVQIVHEPEEIDLFNLHMILIMKSV
jgi:hypothetical protein